MLVSQVYWQDSMIGAVHVAWRALTAWVAQGLVQACEPAPALQPEEQVRVVRVLEWATWSPAFLVANGLRQTVDRSVYICKVAVDSVNTVDAAMQCDGHSWVQTSHP